MPQILGIALNTVDQKHVLAAYVHRFTGDHKPKWAAQLRPNGSPYPLQFRSDREWLANTFFMVTKFGNLDRRANYCTSNPTWPNGK